MTNSVVTLVAKNWPIPTLERAVASHLKDNWGLVPNQDGCNFFSCKDRSPDMQVMVHDGWCEPWHLILERHARSISDVTHVLGNVSKLMFFNVENPTGHYRLDGDDWDILQWKPLWRQETTLCQARSLKPSRLQRSWKPSKVLRDIFLAENSHSWIGTDWKHGWDFTSFKSCPLC